MFINGSQQFVAARSGTKIGFNAKYQATPTVKLPNGKTQGPKGFLGIITGNAKALSQDGTYTQKYWDTKTLSYKKNKTPIPANSVVVDVKHGPTKAIFEKLPEVIKNVRNDGLIKSFIKAMNRLQKKNFARDAREIAPFLQFKPVGDGFSAVLIKDSMQEIDVYRAKRTTTGTLKRALTKAVKLI